MASPVTAGSPTAPFFPWSPSVFVWPSTSASWAAALAPLGQSVTLPWPSVVAATTSMTPTTANATAATVAGPPLSDGRWILVAWALYVPALVVAEIWWGRRPRRPPPLPPPPPPPGAAATLRSPPATVSAADVVAAAHNFALAAASAVMLGGVVTAAGRLVADGRGVVLWCAPLGGASAVSGSVNDPALAAVRYWLYLFYLSKYWELGDTFVLLARRKPLTLLHVWHHMSVMAETWAWLQFDMTLGAVGMAVNAGVHVLMYSYFAASILGHRLPFRRLITRTQIVQFMASFALAAPMVAIHLRRSGGGGIGSGGCAGMPALGLSAFCNASYLALFLRFYHKAYQGGNRSGGGGGSAEGVKAD